MTSNPTFEHDSESTSTEGTLASDTQEGGHLDRNIEQEEAAEQEFQEESPRNDVEAPALQKTETSASKRNIVKWDGPDDRENPRNWKTLYKVWITFQLGMMALAASVGSSIISPAQDAIGEYVGTSQEVTVLVISFYILGFAFGPLIWAPVSEIWGRRVSMLPALFIMSLFAIGTATSKNAQSVFITRFFGGLFGSAPVSNVSAALGDIWDQRARGSAVVFYAAAVVGGPTIGPVIGSALTYNSHLGWRWTEYIAAIWGFAIFALTLFCLPEVYPPVLLKRKAQRLRKETGNQDFYHPHENIKLDFKSLVEKQFSRPLLMLFTEPMVTAISCYASFVYAILYMTLEVFPIVYRTERGYGPIVSTLPFLALFVGVLVSVFINLGNQPRYIRKVDEAQGRPVPEARLPPMAIGGFLFTGGLFWFGWTASPDYHWIVPTIAAAFIGAGFNVIFQQCINFLVDTYALYAASATSANTFLRSILAAAFPLIAGPMFGNVGVPVGMSILGGIAALALPAPWILMKYGVSLRKRSRFAPYQEPPPKKGEKMDVK